MKAYHVWTLAGLWLSCGPLSIAQAPEDKGYFQIELEDFSPPVRDQIKAFEGFPASDFQANDMKGEVRYLSDFRGTTTLLLFWEIDNADAVTMLYDLNQLKIQFKKKISVVAMGYDSREAIQEFLGKNGSDLIIIPNSRPLSEFAFGDELGCPRIFLIDGSGIIRTVIPEAYFRSHGDHKGILEHAVKSML